jgi:biopolymer transport protein ExbB/TolQ
MEFIAKAFEGGGLMMWPILVTSIFVWGIAVERIIYLFFRASSSTEAFLRTLEKAIMAGDLPRALNLTQMPNSALGRVIHAGLAKVQKDIDSVQAAIDEAALRELPKVEKRTAYLAMLGNVAMLLGLLGTITGMIISFGAVASADPGEKAALLARGISEAMNCTAFGLLTAIPALLLYAICQGRTQKIVDEINEGSIRVLNLVLAHRDLLMGKPAPKAGREPEAA